MTDTEDPNIATLREAQEELLDVLDDYQAQWGDDFLAVKYECRPRATAAKAQLQAAVSALASTLAERDRRIAELTRERDEAKDKTRVIAGRLLDVRFDKSEAIAANQAPPAPAPGELSEAIRKMRFGPGFTSVEQHDLILAAAESWQRLQWRPASEAVTGSRVLFMVEPNPGLPVVVIGERSSDRDIWLDEDTDEYNDRLQWREDEVLGWLPLDALPALNGGDDNG